MSADSPHLFSPLALRSVTARNRIWVSPMCQYSVYREDGVPTDWHMVHLGSRAVGGAGLVMVEATAVEARGRITTHDLGLWDDAQAEAFRPITRFMADQGTVPGVQLAHAGRKAHVPEPIVAPSAIAYAEMPAPLAMSEQDIAALIAAFRRAAERALAAGFQTIEVHAAHGYLLHEYLSPLSNHRTDRYGGSFENRIRLPLEVAQVVREVWPERLPLMVRISATDWVEGGWDLEQSVELARRLAPGGVDLIDVSSGGLSPHQQINAVPGYQVPFAEQVRRQAGVMTGAVGLILHGEQAEAIVREGKADAVFIARQSLRDPYWPLRVAHELGYPVAVPIQYQRGW